MTCIYNTNNVVFKRDRHYISNKVDFFVFCVYNTSNAVFKREVTAMSTMFDPSVRKYNQLPAIEDAQVVYSSSTERYPLDNLNDDPLDSFVEKALTGTWAFLTWGVIIFGLVLLFATTPMLRRFILYAIPFIMPLLIFLFPVTTLTMIVGVLYTLSYFIYDWYLKDLGFWNLTDAPIAITIFVILMAVALFCSMLVITGFIMWLSTSRPKGDLLPMEKWECRFKEFKIISEAKDKAWLEKLEDRTTRFEAWCTRIGNKMDAWSARTNAKNEERKAKIKAEKEARKAEAKNKSIYYKIRRIIGIIFKSIGWTIILFFIYAVIYSTFFM